MSIPKLLGTSSVSGNYEIKFFSQNKKYVAKIYHNTIKVGKFSLDDISSRSWTYETISSSDRKKIDSCIEKHKAQVKADEITPTKSSKSKPVSNNLPPLLPSTLTVTSRNSKEDFDLDGTEENFRAVLKKIAELNELDFNERSSLDEPYESDEEFTEKQQKDRKPYVWRDSSILPAFRTTISCSDGNIKGNEILTQCRTRISELLKYISEDDAGATVFPGRYFAVQAGRFAKMKTSLDRNRPFSPGEYIFGRSEVKLSLDEYERLFIIDKDLKNWITQDLGLKITRWDLPYRGYDGVVGIKEIIEAIKGKVISQTEGTPRNVPDNQLGTIQLYCAFPRKYPLDTTYLAILNQGALHKFLDFLNALIFGVEASRNNLVFLTGLLVLQNMRDGSFPTKEGQKGSYFYDDLLDLFPMAVKDTGPGNFIAEKAMYLATKQLEINRSALAGRRPLGFSSFRENPTWLKVALKSEILIYEWLADSEVIAFAGDGEKSSLVEEINQMLNEHVVSYYATG